ncbi:MAG: DUF2752 domain-containing protein [Balneolaceae bacterium]|nr:DUF2752 domain-containing protein [Balneolaceae bacterium]
MRRSNKNLFFLHFEWLVLAAGLLSVAMLNPLVTSESICVIDRVGLGFCPGCGLGRSVAFLFRGDLWSSMQMHPAGIPAVGIILGRIVTIFYRNYNIKKETNHEKNI